MFFELIATIVAGFAAAGVVMVINITLGRRLPKWLMPVAAGLAMFGVTISNEYSWFDRTTAGLPERIQVAVTVEERSWLRPWTQVQPYTKRFVAADLSAIQRNESVPEQRIASLYFFGRWSPVRQTPALFDCGGARSALLGEGVSFAEGGAVAGADWRAMTPDDPLLKLVCEA